MNSLTCWGAVSSFAITSRTEHYSLTVSLLTASQVAYVQVVSPEPSIEALSSLPTVIHIAATGDVGFGARRELIAKPLLKQHGIASLILQNPFYGRRKLPEQRGIALYQLHHFATQTAGVVLESSSLVRYLRDVVQCSKVIGVVGFRCACHMRLST